MPKFNKRRRQLIENGSTGGRPAKARIFVLASDSNPSRYFEFCTYCEDRVRLVDDSIAYHQGLCEQKWIARQEQKRRLALDLDYEDEYC